MKIHRIPDIPGKPDIHIVVPDILRCRLSEDHVIILFFFQLQLYTITQK